MEPEKLAGLHLNFNAVVFHGIDSIAIYLSSMSHVAAFRRIGFLGTACI
jgi:hypothetical protein